MRKVENGKLKSEVVKLCGLAVASLWATLFKRLFLTTLRAVSRLACVDSLVSFSKQTRQQTHRFSHGNMIVAPSIKTVVFPTFHLANKDNYKINSLLVINRP